MLKAYTYKASCGHPLDNDPRNIYYGWRIEYEAGIVAVHNDGYFNTRGEAREDLNRWKRENGVKIKRAKVPTCAN